MKVRLKADMLRTDRRSDNNYKSRSNVHETVSIGTEMTLEAHSRMGFRGILLKKSPCYDNQKETHPSCISKGIRTILLVRHFPYLMSAHHSTSVLDFLYFDAHPLPSSMFSLLHLRQSFFPHGLTSSVSLLLFSHLIMIPHHPALAGS